MERGRAISMDQRTKAESDLAVAAASILAREKFIDWLEDEGRAMGRDLPRGASLPVREAIEEIVAEHGPAIFRRIAKTHFKIAPPT